MSFSEWYYLPIAAVVNGLFQIFWQKQVAGKTLKRFWPLALVFVGSLLNAWGIDVIQRVYDIFSFVHVMKVSLGCWLMFSAATSAKHYADNGWSKKNFWIDYGGDLIGFSLMGIIIYVLT